MGKDLFYMFDGCKRDKLAE